MRNIKLIVEYDGKNYCGFQWQPRRKTIQSELENALSQLFDKKLKIAAASGRTDSGVHALHQVVNFNVEANHKIEQIQKGLNRYLPEDIAVREVKEVSPDFHARYSAKSKTYEYCVYNRPTRSPFFSKTAYHVPHALNFSAMCMGAKIFVGRNDFKSFCAARSSIEKNGTSTVRTIKRFVVKREGASIKFQVEADGFLYRMVRNLVGTLLEVGEGKISYAELKRILKARDRRQSGRTVPGHGLTLLDVSY